MGTIDRIGIFVQFVEILGVLVKGEDFQVPRGPQLLEQLFCQVGAKMRRGHVFFGWHYYRWWNARFTLVRIVVSPRRVKVLCRSFAPQQQLHR